MVRYILFGLWSTDLLEGAGQYDDDAYLLSTMNLLSAKTGVPHLTADSFANVSVECSG